MKPTFSAMDGVEMMAKLADLRDVDYQNTLVIHSLIEILIEKGVLTREELLAKARQLDSEQNPQIVSLEQLDGHTQIVKPKHAPHR